MNSLYRKSRFSQYGGNISPAALFASFTVLFAGVVLVIFGLGDHLFPRPDLPPEQVFGGPIPASLKVHATFETEEGLIGELIDPKTNLSISIVRERPHNSPPTVLAQDKLLEAIKAYKLRQELNEHFGSLPLKYASAHFDGRRAKFLETVTLPFGSKDISAITFHVKFEQYYTLALFEQDNARVLLLVMRPEQPVQQERLAEILRSLQST